MSNLNPIDFISDNQGNIIQTYRDLHALAEPSWGEKETSAYLIAKLQAAGFTVQTFSGHYGFIAEIEGKTSNVVGLRADMDALVQEVDHVVRANHSCGHDAHSTMVLHTALALKQAGIRPEKTIRFIFQPAEETGEGAKRFMEAGILNDIEMLFGIHLRPTFEVPYGKAAPAIVHGASVTTVGVIYGLQAHAARPENGSNVIEAASLLIQVLQGIRLQVGCSFSVKMTQLHSGESANTIPGKASFTLDLRAQSNEGMTELQEKTAKVLESVGNLTNTQINYEFQGFVPAAALNEKMIEIAKKSIADICGPEHLVEPCITRGGEDFHFYTMKHPHIAATMIGLGCGLEPGLHHPQMSFQIDALNYGTKILTVCLLNAAKI
ncbi:amidohydrolase [Lysinibacillus sp. NPDC093216]|uniref:amidohydrolase n=1 Tax=Lysinibacillus sp. NPDC093216 TaxID=3390576 RepID=UPI003D01AF75